MPCLPSYFGSPKTSESLNSDFFQSRTFWHYSEAPWRLGYMVSISHTLPMRLKDKCANKRGILSGSWHGLIYDLGLSWECKSKGTKSKTK